jgi:hypothetical protein
MFMMANLEEIQIPFPLIASRVKTGVTGTHHPLAHLQTTQTGVKEKEKEKEEGSVDVNKEDAPGVNMHVCY